MTATSAQQQTGTTRAEREPSAAETAALYTRLADALATRPTKKPSANNPAG